MLQFDLRFAFGKPYTPQYTLRLGTFREDPKNLPVKKVPGYIATTAGSRCEDHDLCY